MEQELIEIIEGLLNQQLLKEKRQSVIDGPLKEHLKDIASYHVLVGWNIGKEEARERLNKLLKKRDKNGRNKRH